MIDSDLFTLNNREKAVIIWILIFSALALSRKLYRKDILTSIFNLLKALVQNVRIFTAMLLYVTLIVFLFYKINLWNVSLIKDTVFWLLGTAVVLLVNSNKASEDKQFFKNVLLNSLKFILLLEFVVNMYTFSLAAELILMPILFIIGVMSALAKIKKEGGPIKKIADFILSAFGLYIIVFVLFNTFRDYRNLVTIENLRALLLPPLLTFAYMPFLYFVALYMAYEKLFLRLDIFFEKDKALARFTKRKIFTLCLVNLRKLNEFVKENTKEFMRLNDKDDVLSMLRKFNKKKS